MEPGRAYLVIASHLPLVRITSTVRFFRGVAAVRKQLIDAEGLVCYTLRARPLARDYWTLSVWTDRSALEARADTAARRFDELAQATHGTNEVRALGDHDRRRPATLGGSTGAPGFSLISQLVRIAVDPRVQTGLDDRRDTTRAAPKLSSHFGRASLLLPLEP